MKLINTFVALLLAVAAAALGMLFIGAQEQHAEMLKQRFWGMLGLRFTFASTSGLVWAALWWGVNWGLQKAGFAKEINLSKTAFLLLVSVLSGSLVGALVFCLP